MRVKIARGLHIIYLTFAALIGGLTLLWNKHLAAAGSPFSSPTFGSCPTHKGYAAATKLLPGSKSMCCSISQRTNPSMLHPIHLLYAHAPTFDWANRLQSTCREQEQQYFYSAGKHSCRISSTRRCYQQGEHY